MQASKFDLVNVFISQKKGQSNTNSKGTTTMKIFKLCQITFRVQLINKLQKPVCNRFHDISKVCNANNVCFESKPLLNMHKVTEKRSQWKRQRWMGD